MAKQTISVTLFLILLIFFGTAFYFYADPNQLKPFLKDAVKKRTGYELTINDSMSWSFYPMFSIHFDHLEIKRPLQTTSFVKLDDVRFSVSAIDWLKRKTDLDHRIIIKKAVIKQLQFQDIDMQMKWQEGHWFLSPISATFYGGKIQGMIENKHFEGHPEWQGDFSLSQVDVTPLLHDMINKPSRFHVTGKLDANLKVSTQGITTEEINSNLKAITNFNIINGTIDGIDVNYYIRAADAILHKISLPQMSMENSTHFKTLRGTVLDEHEILNFKDVVLSADNFTATVNGDLALKNNIVNIDSRITPIIENNNLFEIPLTISGKLDNPSIKINLKAIDKKIVNEKLDKLKIKAKTLLNKFISDI